MFWPKAALLSILGLSALVSAQRVSDGVYFIVAAATDSQFSVSHQGPEEPLVLVNGPNKEGIWDIEASGTGQTIKNVLTGGWTANDIPNSDRVWAVTGDQLTHTAWNVTAFNDGYQISLPDMSDEERLYWTPDFALRRLYLSQQKVSDVQVWLLRDILALADECDV
ncbi:hypothetical protein NP233_g7641 [Leucocoprinus birnbaumii]|uniref:Ricin B lectin domain-containing protein n=1 Tax=Leucocoprinus birnbaumii TaxID=56174 RepID=A0AAD5YUE8_9AGAR|nr:hypothetical protein NP233_g7641 [Leucocoprinus birnbaumii]